MGYSKCVLQKKPKLPTVFAVSKDVWLITFVGGLGDVVSRVLSHSISDTSRGYPSQETVSEVRNYNSEVLAAAPLLS